MRGSDQFSLWNGIESCHTRITQSPSSRSSSPTDPVGAFLYWVNSMRIWNMGQSGQWLAFSIEKLKKQYRIRSSVNVWCINYMKPREVFHTQFTTLPPRCFHLCDTLPKVTAIWSWLTRIEIILAFNQQLADTLRPPTPNRQYSQVLIAPLSLPIYFSMKSIWLRRVRLAELAD